MNYTPKSFHESVQDKPQPTCCSPSQALSLHWHREIPLYLRLLLFKSEPFGQNQASSIPVISAMENINHSLKLVAYHHHRHHLLVSCSIILALCFFSSVPVQALNIGVQKIDATVSVVCFSFLFFSFLN